MIRAKTKKMTTLQQQGNILDFQMISPRKRARAKLKEIQNHQNYQNHTKPFDPIRTPIKSINPVRSNLRTADRTTMPAYTDTDLSLSPEKGISSIPRSSATQVNKPQIPSIRQGEVQRSSTAYGNTKSPIPRGKKCFVTPGRISNRARQGKSKLRGNGAGKQADRLSLGYASYTATPQNLQRALEIVVSPRTMTTRVDGSVFSPRTVRVYKRHVVNFFDTGYANAIHIAGLMNQIKALEQEQVRLVGVLNGRQAQLDQLNREAVLRGEGTVERGGDGRQEVEEGEIAEAVEK